MHCLTYQQEAVQPIRTYYPLSFVWQFVIFPHLLFFSLLGMTKAHVDLSGYGQRHQFKTIMMIINGEDDHSHRNDDEKYGVHAAVERCKC